jgi:hypothetical protein
MTELGIPTVPAVRREKVGEGVAFALDGHHFTADPGLDVKAAANAATVPLSVILVSVRSRTPVSRCRCRPLSTARR